MAKKSVSAFKAIMSALALFLIFTTAAFAQESTTEGAVMVTSYMKTKLSLNDGQYSRVLDINKVYLQKVKSNNGATTVEKAKNQKAYNEERDAKLKSVLSDSQYKIYVANRPAHAKKYREAEGKK